MTTAGQAGRLALALDDALSRMTPKQLEELATLVSDNAPPTLQALLDQQQAATAASLANLDAEAPLLGGEVIHVAPVEMHGWVRLGLFEAYTGWVVGETRTCMHSPQASHPQPVYAAAWRPGLVVCIRCIHLLALPRGSVKDRTCDGCGKVVAGVEHGDGIHPSRVQYGPLVLMFGVCGDCLPATARTA